MAGGFAAGAAYLAAPARAVSLSQQCRLHRGTAQSVLWFKRVPPTPAALLPRSPPPLLPTLPPRSLERTTAAMAGLPRSMDSHTAQGQRAVAAAADRNKEPILAVLKEFLGGSQEGLVLEVASGTGQHTAHFAAALPQLTWQPTEYAADDMGSIAAWAEGLPNIKPPLQLDASQPDRWAVPAGACRAVYCANMCHISPWAATQGLLAGAGSVLQPGGELFIYGPFSVDGRPTTESNTAFDASLRQRNPEWGYRDCADVTACAAAAGLQLVERRGMPANNFMLIYRKH